MQGEPTSMIVRRARKRANQVHAHTATTMTTKTGAIAMRPQEQPAQCILHTGMTT